MKVIEGNQYTFQYEIKGTTAKINYLGVQKKHRNKGIATQLLQHCELWSKENACTEFASDCEISNAESYVFHMKFGFQEANRIICFKKDITLQS